MSVTHDSIDALKEVVEPSLTSLVVTEYDGETDSSGRYCGLGTAITDSGCEYEGEFFNGLFHGNGRLVWKDGVVFEGERAHSSV